MLTIVKLSDVNSQPRLKVDLPQLRIGDPIALRASLERETQGRTEVLKVDCRFRVTAVGYEANGQTQIASLDCIDRTPSWQAVKSRPLAASRLRQLGPSRFAPTSLDDSYEEETPSW